MNKLPAYLFEYTGRKFFVEDLIMALKKIGIKSGDKLFVHSDLKSFGKVNPQIAGEEYLGAFLAALIDSVGKNGTVIMPTFSYSFCRGEIYDPQKTPSTVGSLTEYFRQSAGVVRTIDPIFSVAIWGADRKFYQTVGSDCFGANSIFQKIHDANFKILFLGETFALTYLHFIEQAHRIPYRFIKKFAGKILTDGKLTERTFDYFVRPLDGSVGYDLGEIAHFIDKKGILRKSKLGYSNVCLVGARDVYRVIARALGENLRFLISTENKNE